MKFEKMKSFGGGPSSSIGIMRFFDQDMGGPKLSPEFVLAFVLLFVFVMLVLHFIA
ncbi:MAG: preprotein translocase subunit Sec61beta [Candidatus Diapherotrites archaeon]|nr:preprotein translocase subunit Sec61beta [Candidatus Diapherotrites archaeon]